MRVELCAGTTMNVAQWLNAIDLGQYEAVFREQLNSRRKDPYEAATAALREDTQQWWADTLARDLAGYTTAC